MKSILTCIYDKVSGQYMSPVPSINEDSAKRNLKASIALDSTTLLCSNPGDFQLVAIGEFDDSTGTISPAPVTVLCEVSALLGGAINDN